MIRIDLRLLPLDENGANAKQIEAANQEATIASAHLKKLIGKRRCRKHPSSPNKIRITATLSGKVQADLMFVCCPEFAKLIK